MCRYCYMTQCLLLHNLKSFPLSTCDYNPNTKQRETLFITSLGQVLKIKKSEIERYITMLILFTATSFV